MFYGLYSSRGRSKGGDNYPHPPPKKKNNIRSPQL